MPETTDSSIFGNNNAQLTVIENLLTSIKTDSATINGTLVADLTLIKTGLSNLATLLTQTNTTLTQTNTTLTQTNVLLTQTLQAVLPQSIKGFRINLKGKGQNNLMATKTMKASLDFQLADNGTVTGTLSFVDAAGLTTNLAPGQTASVPSWTPSSPAIVATAAADGLSAVITPATPPVLATDVTITVSAVTITNADGTTLVLPAETSEGIDVVGSGVAGFAISL